MTGFCLLSNGFLGVEHARQIHGLKRIAIVDWDVHHCNGAESAFNDDPDIWTTSMHQDNRLPPNHGGMTEAGTGAGAGANLNIPLFPGSGSGAHRAAFDQLVAPALEDFKPEMIFVASGFDASALDPLGHMMLSSQDYAYMTDALLAIADTYCQGRMFMTHKGGYSVAYVSYCNLAVLERMSGHDTGVADPFLDFIENYGRQKLLPHQQAVIDEIAAHDPKTKT